MNKQRLISGLSAKTFVLSLVLIFFSFLPRSSDLSIAGSPSSTRVPETAKKLRILVLYSLDLPKPPSEDASEGRSDATSSASPRGPNPKYVAEIMAWELREEGKVKVMAFYEINEITEIFDHHVIVVGSISKGGEISDTTKSIFHTLQEMSPAERRENFSRKIVSPFVTSDSYDGCEESLAVVMKSLENYQLWITPGLIITEDMEFDDAAEKIRFSTSKLREMIHQKRNSLE